MLNYLKRSQKKRKEGTRIDLNPTNSVTTFNINSLSTPIKRQRWSDLEKKQDSTICFLQQTHFKYKDTNRLIK